MTPHFVLFPFMAQGHMIPLIDFAKLLAARGVIITIVTTPINAARFSSTIKRAIESGLQIRVMELQFPKTEDLPQGCENADMLPSLGMLIKFMIASNLLHDSAEALFQHLTPKPSCIISDSILHFTGKIAKKFNIPRVVFYENSSMYRVCLLMLHTRTSVEIADSGSNVVFHDLPHEMKFTTSQMPVHVASIPIFKDFFQLVHQANFESFGSLVNTFEELEPDYIQKFQQETKNRVWSIGPVSLSNQDDLDKFQRGNLASVDVPECIKWLDLQNPGSVVYVCLGTLTDNNPSELKEIAYGLESSNIAFIWAVKGNATDELNKFVEEDGFEERIKGRGLVIRGWAPQVLILSHPAIGGFLTHCGWNSTLEGIAAGVPLLTWPGFADQFANEKLIVQVLNIGVNVFDDEKEKEKGVKRDLIKKGVEKLMSPDEQGKQRRERAKEMGEKAKRAVEGDGSSHLNITKFITEISDYQVICA